MASHEDVGAGYDAGAIGHELVGRRSKDAPMVDARSLTVDLAVTGVDEATEKFDRLRIAIERTVSALAELADHKHGGFELKMCGNLVHIEVKPAAAVA